jgi:hypothetical protein
VFSKPFARWILSVREIWLGCVSYSGSRIRRNISIETFLPQIVPMVIAIIPARDGQKFSSKTP